MMVYDFDGVIVENSRAEKLWRWFAEKIRIKTPGFLFSLQEIIEFATGKKLKPKDETIEIINKTNQKNRCFLGILTDRSLWSLARSFEKICLDFRNFSFIQTRESILDCLIKKPLPLPAANFKSQKTKPDESMFENLKEFAEKKDIKIKIEEILIVEDTPQIIKAAKANGFYAIHIKHINYLRYI